MEKDGMEKDIIIMVFRFFNKKCIFNGELEFEGEYLMEKDGMGKEKNIMKW